MSFLQNVNSGDTLKDALLTAYGFILPISVSTGEAALVVGFLNVAVVSAFRYLELRRRNNRDEEIARLQSSIEKLTPVPHTATQEVR